MNNKKGFTLAELLVVVAIIAVLVAIAIPVFSSQLEKAREATDLANIRSTYAEIMTAIVSEDTDIDTTKGGIKLSNGEYLKDLEELHPLKSNNDVFCISNGRENIYIALIKLEHKGKTWELENVKETLEGLNNELVISDDYVINEDEPLYAYLYFDVYPGNNLFCIHFIDEQTIKEVSF